MSKSSDSSFRSFLILSVLLLVSFSIQAQTFSQSRNCGTMDALSERMASDPDYAQFRNAAVNMNKSASSYIPCNGSNSIVVPVAFHFDETFSCTDIACIQTEVADQMSILNAAFADNTSASTTMVAACPSAYEDANGNSVVSTGTCISFCYATPPPGNAQGIQDCDLPITINEFNGGLNGGGNGAPGWSGILNIFITSNQCLGVADGIPGAANGDGVTVCSEAFGGLGGPSPGCGSGLDDNSTFGEGKTLIHEIGHYLGLYHTFQGGCGTQEENPPGPIQILDTPPAGSSYAGCNSTSCVTSSCGNVQAIANYMDYTDDNCMTMFTEDQAAVMNYWANQLFGASNSACSQATTLASCGSTTATCAYAADFLPADGEVIDLCLDDTNIIQITDLSAANPVSWNWTITAVSGDLVFTPSSSTNQNPVLTFSGGTSGVINLSLTSCDASPVCETETHTITVNLLSGAACPNECDYSLLLYDTFGDGWNGATMEVFQDGVSLGVAGSTFTSGSTDGPYILTLTEGSVLELVQTNGTYPAEEGATLTDPFGNIIFDTSAGNIGSGTVFTYAVQCSAPSCSDGIQNGDETGVDCGGSSCQACPFCPSGQSDIFVEDFNGCALPAGWATSHTNTNGGVDAIGYCEDGFNFFAFDCSEYPSGGALGNASFDGCVAVMDDDNPGGSNDPNGIACITSPLIDLASCSSADLSFDWEHRSLGGSEFYTETSADGVNWTSVQSSIATENGSESISISSFSSSFQVRFCFNDADGWQWGAAFDNVRICADCSPVTNCPDTLQLSNLIADDMYAADLLIQSDGQVPAGGNVSMQAGQEIELQPNFDADQNSDVYIYIDGCPQSKSQTDQTSPESQE